jgi:outer membrane receptor protein involved in Fe transport
MLYARLASGYRAGGINGAAFPQFSYEPDKTYNYEIGLKGDFLDHALSVDASVYHIDWKDIQLGYLGGPTGSYLVNGGKAKSQGVELSLSARPLTGFTVAGWVVFGEAELAEDFPAGAVFAEKSGERLPFSSRWSGNLSLEQQFQVTSDVTAFVGGQWSYIGNRPRAYALPGPRLFPAYTRTDLRAGVRYHSWDVGLFANNITDRRGILAEGNPIGTGYVYIQPRTVGLSVGYDF